MTRTRIDYRAAAGDAAWWVAADEGALVVLSPAVSATTAVSVWRGLGTGGIGAVLDALTGAFGTSLTAIPPFALAVAEAGGLRVAVRGDIEIVVEADAPQSVSGTGVATWTERFVPGATRATVTPAGVPLAPLADLPLRSGVVLADLVRLDLGAGTRPRLVDETQGSTTSLPSETPESEDSRPAGAEAAALAAPVTPAPRTPAVSAEAAPAASVIDALPPGLLAPHGDQSADDQAPGDGALDEPVEEPEAHAPEQPAPDTSADTLIPEATAAEAAAAPVDEYDMLWGETVARPVSAAAIASVDPDAEAVADPDAAARADGIGTEAGADAPATELGDHDGATIAVADLRAMRAARAEREAFESTDSVPARRPARGRIRLSTGRVVELERPVVIGRRPKSTRTSGAELPTLVAVDSPEQDISRSHVEIRAEGEHVLVTDLDTTNGTVLRRGGNEPVRLHPGEPTMVVTGDVLDLGDEVTVTFEDLP